MVSNKHQDNSLTNSPKLFFKWDLFNPSLIIHFLLILKGLLLKCFWFMLMTFCSLEIILLVWTVWRSCWMTGCLERPWFFEVLFSRHGKTGQTRLTRPVWPVTRLTRLKMTRFDPRPVLTRDPFDPTRTRPDPPVLPCLPMMSKLRLRCNFYKIFTYFSLLNMLCTLL